MILGNKAIKEEMDKGHILISPFREDFLKGTSYDVRLDRYFVSPGENTSEIIKSRTKGADLTDPKVVEALYGYWVESDGVVLAPGVKILASTIEQIGSLTTDITTEIKAKSTFGRSIGLVCGCADGGAPGFATHWTLELVNNSPYTISLDYGTVIAQVKFIRVEGCDILYKGKYNADAGEAKTYSPEERGRMMAPNALKRVLDDLNPVLYR